VIEVLMVYREQLDTLVKKETVENQDLQEYQVMRDRRETLVR